MRKMIAGVLAILGFLLLTFAPLLVSIYFFKLDNKGMGVVSLTCFILAIGLFTLFVMADKPRFQGTIIGLEGLWQRLLLLCMYFPIATLCYYK